MNRSSRGKFPSPFEVAVPPGCEGWQRLYPYYHVFSEERRTSEESRFWFADRIHHAEPLYPFDAIICEAIWVALSQYNTRVFVMPSALGIDQRIVNGYLYLSPNSVTDPALIEQRAEHFRRRAGYYFEHWGELYEQWLRKTQSHIESLEAIEIRDLPELEAEAVVTEGQGVASGYHLLEAYNRTIENLLKVWQYHFEMLNLGYAAYLTFLEFCKLAFPGISDQTVAQMVSGIDVLLFRPDDELRKLAHLAIALDIGPVLKQAASPSKILADLQETENGKQWCRALDEAKQPWFNFSTGTGFYHHDRSWIDDLSFPFVALRSYVEKLEQGGNIERPLDAIRSERDRITTEYAQLVKNDEDRKVFADLLKLARTVYPYVENHNFFVEHWHHTVFWKKMREFGKILVHHGFITSTDDIFFLNRYEIQAALYDLIAAWSVGADARGPRIWPAEIEHRREIYQGFRQSPPPPALGTPPESITDPLMIMLWGITQATVINWLGIESAEGEQRELKGCAASPGIVEGPVRVVNRTEQLNEVLPGEILVCPVTSPSWAPVFSRIKATVSDVGGVMCHAAIVSREYGLPAVVGTGFGTRLIKTGQRIRVNGDSGTVQILS
ncbi:hypothetical protein WL04_21895 [Burkholderia ubonensis]|uniref:PEP-utilizing enzyme n=1 Tax=Burkholderia ubonensis TaxID=101571 RepID=UPI000755FA2F|nr:PEP-utilizing enzyme [Burkholderia ubonensis]KVA72442.1 hypothetical protein WM36_24220 [Burkholderia ubonensis]KVD32845.1 hypothetical protein WI83_15825 [Burkholderia ubonensis]KVO62422.1 hypothetical protein WJ77_06180 [Burkholderia ubonensis]KVP72588.1 hypothetical protein WJ94_24840 [Burkholderia ubonensis]KVR61255.1 hypothetical protein WK20_00120 [Burkholderia ubonensis]